MKMRQQTKSTCIPKLWKSYIKHAEFAFQPIVNIHTGLSYGYEALLRNYEQDGFLSVDTLLNKAYAEEILTPLELQLHEKAIEKFTRIPSRHVERLFLNIDSRLLHMTPSLLDVYTELLEQHTVSFNSVCFEISGQQNLLNSTVIEILGDYRKKGVKIGFDNVGTGFSELQCLYHMKPDFLKIDQFFIKGIASDSKKKLLVSNLLNAAHTLGILTVALGVETNTEFYACREIGFDLLQGNFIQEPQADVVALRPRYHAAQQLICHDRRQSLSDQKLISTKMKFIPAISAEADICDVFDVFRKHQDERFFPVLNQNGEPVGGIHENDLKKYTYHQYGRDLLKNPSSQKTIRDFLVEVPIADIHTSIEKILEIFSLNEEGEGILIVDNMQYAGFLDARSLLEVLNEKNLLIAREQNPLTRLPGNMRIHEYVSKALDATCDSYFLIYLDFDHFKPFNDTYGFRTGDRVILLFAELLRKVEAQHPHFFAAHIGGDDFFMGMKNVLAETSRQRVKELIEQFRREAESFYEPQAIKDGYIVSLNRSGEKERFSLLSVSAVILELPPDRPLYSTEQLSAILASLKKRAKHAENGICLANITTWIDCKLPH